jgi:hypothetical protein
MPAGGDKDAGVPVDRQPGKDVGHLACQVGRGEAVARGGRLLRVRIDQGDGEPGLARRPGQGLADVPGADGDQLRRESDRLDIDLHLAAADEAVLLGELEGELGEVPPASQTGRGHVSASIRPPPRPRSSRPADQHLGPGLARRRTGAVDDDGQAAGSAPASGEPVPRRSAGLP